MEGNVGDQMETFPLLQRLNSWGVKVDVYLSTIGNVHKKLDPNMRDRVMPYVTKIYENGIGLDMEV